VAAIRQAKYQSRPETIVTLPQKRPGLLRQVPVAVWPLGERKKAFFTANRA